MIDFERKSSYNFSDLLRIMEILRKNCPWDREQTHVSLLDTLLEESYEVALAVQRGSAANLEEELGDLLDRLSDVESSSRDASNGLLVTVKRAEALIGDQQRLIAEQRSQIDVQQRQIEVLMKTLGAQANKEKHKTGLFARFLSWSF